jgi:PAS domain S-box-containing protein
VRGFEEEIAFADGARVQLYGNAVPLRDADGAIRGSIGAFVDITPIKTAEAALRASEARLRESEERLRLATQAAAIGVWSWDVASDRVHWTAECYAIVDVDHVDGTADAFQRAIHPEDVERVWAAVGDAIADRTPFECEFRIVRPDGEVRWVANLGRVDYDAAGGASRVLGIVMDVTDRKAAEQALREADRRKDEFLAIIAHELRNPLAPIRNAVRVAQRLGAGDPQLRQMHDVIERQADQLTRIVEDLLDVAQITQGRVVLRRERLDVVSIVARAIETSRPLLDAQRHHLSVALPPEPLRVDGDLVRLAQVLSNLLNNAAKYTEPGGRIWLGAEADGDEILLRVRDDGVGIAPEALGRIFDLFMQADRSLDRAQGGFGIGLTLVRRLIELHGGRVEAFSPGLGGGSEFVVHLPTARAAARLRESAGPPALPIVPTVPHRVLVVDDNSDAADSLALLLRIDGHDVRVAHEGDGAIATARGFRPEVVLLDIGLPGMSGYEVARRLRVEPDASAPTLVALTGHGQREDRQRTSAAGFDHHLTKPVDYETLRALLGMLGDARVESRDRDFD